MTEPDKKVGLLGMTDEQLRNGYQQRLENVQFSANDFYKEIERRTQERYSTAMRRLTWVTAFLTFIATVATVLALFSTFRAQCHFIRHKSEFYES